ncbi:MAG: hypothetical protein N2557_03635 [Hydrogenophilus sp.]|nr:hypothetical protein [Hydrogenophilus sp.]
MIGGVTAYPRWEEVGGAPLRAGEGRVASGREGGERSREGEGVRNRDAERERKVARLREIDREVRAHEMAHVAAGGDLVTRGAQFNTVRGPDGKQYAVGGDVQIDVSPGRTPEETIAKAERIRRAALAPANPSPQDLKVAAKATQMAMAARMELIERRLREERGEEKGQTAGVEGSGRTPGAEGTRGGERRGINGKEGGTGGVTESARGEGGGYWRSWWQSSGVGATGTSETLRGLSWRSTQALALYAANR